MEELTYTAIEQSRFIKYFQQPKRKRGRPQKQKRKRGKRARAAKNKLANEASAKTKEKAVLVANLEGALTMASRRVRSRINWDTAGRSELRERIAKSWKTKTDMCRDGESFARFCIRVGIHQGSLRRFMKAEGKYVCKKRGRPTLLPQSVMRHICEGK